MSVASYPDKVTQTLPSRLVLDFNHVGLSLLEYCRDSLCPIVMETGEADESGVAGLSDSGFEERFECWVPSSTMRFQDNG